MLSANNTNKILLKKGKIYSSRKNIILKKFEATDVIVNVVDGVPMFELYSVGMALGYTKTAKGKHYPRNERIDTIVKNAGISVVVHSGQQLINENQLYDFILSLINLMKSLFYAGFSP